jgi:anti-sigma regulatory factor (Ser/Thr protein kinase)
MTSVARPAGRRLASFTVPSAPGNERLVLTRIAEAVAGRGLPAARVERLKTAVAEATMNAIEHGNRNRADVPVDIEVIQSGADIVVAISDCGGEHGPAAPAEEPDLARKLDGEQSPRGWGLFLIRNMVDSLDETTEGRRHTILLTMRAGEPAEKGADGETQL